MQRWLSLSTAVQEKGSHSHNISSMISAFASLILDMILLIALLKALVTVNILKTYLNILRAQLGIRSHTTYSNANMCKIWKITSRNKEKIKNFPLNYVHMFGYEHKKLNLPIYTRMMDFLREKMKQGIENCRFLFIAFLIVRYTLSHMTEKMLQAYRMLPGSRSIQGVSNFMQLSLTVLSNNLRITITGKRNI